MSNLNEQISNIEGDAPNRHARRTVESMIADHVADAMAIEYLAFMNWGLSARKSGPDWFDVDDKKKKPYLKEAISFPCHARELFFDIETDPMRDICYLHGFLERRVQRQPTRPAGLVLRER